MQQEIKQAMIDTFGIELKGTLKSEWEKYYLINKIKQQRNTGKKTASKIVKLNSQTKH